MGRGGTGAGNRRDVRARPGGDGGDPGGGNTCVCVCRVSHHGWARGWSLTGEDRHTSVQVGSRVLGRGDDHETRAPVRPAPTGGTKSDTVPRQSGLPCSLPCGQRPSRAQRGLPALTEAAFHPPAAPETSCRKFGRHTKWQRCSRKSPTQSRAAVHDTTQGQPPGPQQGRARGRTVAGGLWGPSPEAQPGRSLPHGPTASLCRRFVMMNMLRNGSSFSLTAGHSLERLSYVFSLKIEK